MSAAALRRKDAKLRADRYHAAAHAAALAKAGYDSRNPPPERKKGGKDGR